MALLDEPDQLNGSASDCLSECSIAATQENHGEPKSMLTLLIQLAST
jgi:hypothetical protein